MARRQPELNAKLLAGPAATLGLLSLTMSKSIGGFSLGAKKPSKRKRAAGDTTVAAAAVPQRELIKGVGRNGALQTVERKQRTGPIVISAQGNSWNADMVTGQQSQRGYGSSAVAAGAGDEKKKHVPSFNPAAEADAEEVARSAARQAQAPKKETIYGLNVMSDGKSMEPGGGGAAAAAAAAEPEPEPEPEPEAPKAPEPELTLEEEAMRELYREARGETVSELENKSLVISGAGTGSGEFEGVGALAERKAADKRSTLSETEKYRRDAANRPDVADGDAYQATPIDDFGKALLRGMGWAPGKAIGLNSSGLAKPIEFVPRPGRLGLGAKPMAPPPGMVGRGNYKGNMAAKPGEREGQVVKDGADYKGGHREIGTTNKRKELEPGSDVTITGGRHKGLVGRVLRVGGSVDGDGLVLRLRNDEEVSCRARDVRMEVAKPREKKRGSSSSSRSSASRDRGSSSRDGRESSSSSSSSKRKKHKQDKHSSSSSSSGGGGGGSSGSEMWVLPSIRVKVVSKSFGGGKYYLKKGVLQDVQSKRESLLLLESGEVVEAVPQKALETCIPKREGAGVVVVSGPLRGQKGKMLRKESKGVAVQLSADSSVHSFDLFSICEYVGSVDDD